MKALRHKLTIIFIPFIFFTSLLTIACSIIYYFLLVSNLISTESLAVEIVSLFIPVPYVNFIFRHRVKIIMERKEGISGPRIRILSTIIGATLLPLFVTLMFVGKFYATQTGTLHNANIPAGIKTVTLSYVIFTWCFVIALVFILLLSCRISTLNLDKYFAAKKS